MSHTPGEWVAECFSNGAFDVVARFQGSNGGNLVLASRQTYEGREKEMHANAHIFAAAPDLLAALEGMLWYFDEADCEHPVGLEKVAAARAAIAKAKGQA